MNRTLKTLSVLLLITALVLTVFKLGDNGKKQVVIDDSSSSRVFEANKPKTMEKEQKNRIHIRFSPTSVSFKESE